MDAQAEIHKAQPENNILTEGIKQHQFRKSNTPKHQLVIEGPYHEQQPVEEALDRMKAAVVVVLSQKVFEKRDLPIFHSSRPLIRTILDLAPVGLEAQVQGAVFAARVIHLRQKKD